MLSKTNIGLFLLVFSLGTCWLSSANLFNPIVKDEGLFFEQKKDFYSDNTNSPLDRNVDQDPKERYSRSTEMKQKLVSNLENVGD